jgi:hypothetical protein
MDSAGTACSQAAMGLGRPGRPGDRAGAGPRGPVLARRKPGVNNQVAHDTGTTHLRHGRATAGPFTDVRPAQEAGRV